MPKWDPWAWALGLAAAMGQSQLAQTSQLAHVTRDEISCVGVSPHSDLWWIPWDNGYRSSLARYFIPGHVGWGGRASWDCSTLGG